MCIFPHIAMNIPSKGGAPLKHSKSGLFLMEFIIVLLFFSLASTICIRLFVKSSTLSNDTVDLTYAVTQAQNLAEGFLASNGDPAQMEALFPGMQATKDNVLQLTEDSYTSTITFSTGENGLMQGDIAVYLTGSSDSIYSLQVQRYVPERGTANE